MVAGLFLAAALMVPGILAPLNHQWMRFGLLLHKITNPIIMGLVFFVTVTPTALVMKMMGLDPLNRKIDRNAKFLLDQSDPTGAVTQNHEIPILRAAMSFVLEIWPFMRARKKFWLLSIMLIMMLYGGLVILTEGSAIAPFIYTIF